MSEKLNVELPGFPGLLADMAMVPLMYFLSGTWKEAPQETHFWNCTHLKRVEVNHLDPGKMVYHGGNPSTSRRTHFGIPIAHMPLFGGWRDYIVLEPSEYGRDWHIGWICEDNVIGVSRIPLLGAVRMLIGPGGVFFFGVTMEDGTQIPIREAGDGQIGDGGEWANIKLR